MKKLKEKLQNENIVFFTQMIVHIALIAIFAQCAFLQVAKQWQVTAISILGLNLLFVGLFIINWSTKKINQYFAEK